MDSRRQIADTLLVTLKDSYPEAQGLPDDLYGFLEVPPDKNMGDYAFPCFRLSKALRKAPPMIAAQLAGVYAQPDLARAEAVNGYLNFFLNRGNFAQQTLDRSEEHTSELQSPQ